MLTADIVRTKIKNRPEHYKQLYHEINMAIVTIFYGAVLQVMLARTRYSLVDVLGLAYCGYPLLHCLQC